MGDFFQSGKVRLTDLEVDGNRVRFQVVHRTGVSMKVTLTLVDGQLRGEAMPVGVDEDRCDIELDRVPLEDAF